jgi:hypothetical protein
MTEIDPSIPPGDDFSVSLRGLPISERVPKARVA